MPIKAASDKLIREMEMFGQDFENYGKEEKEEVEEVCFHTLPCTTERPDERADELSLSRF
jgi:hypothetical protein